MKESKEHCGPFLPPTSFDNTTRQEFISLLPQHIVLESYWEYFKVAKWMGNFQCDLGEPVQIRTFSSVRLVKNHHPVFKQTVNLIWFTNCTLSIPSFSLLSAGALWYPNVIAWCQMLSEPKQNLWSILPLVVLLYAFNCSFFNPRPSLLMDLNLVKL